MFEHPGVFQAEAKEPLYDVTFGLAPRWKGTEGYFRNFCVKNGILKFNMMLAKICRIVLFFTSILPLSD
jgi:hypothetical protein